MINSITDVFKLNDKNYMPGFGLGVYKTSAGEETYRTVIKALNIGYRHIDTAPIYGNEVDVGRAIRESGLKREEVFVTTKLWPLHFSDAERSFYESYNKLKLEYIDLFLLHWPGLNDSQRYYAWETISNLKEKGLIRSIGVSNFLVKHLKDIIQKTGIEPVNNQIELHPWYQQHEVRQFCQSNGITVTAWGPIFHGHLNEEPLMKELGLKYDRSPAQVTLRWHIQNEIIVIPKTSKEERLLDNTKLFDFYILPEDMKRIEALNGRRQLGFDPLTYRGNLDIIEE